MNTESKPMYEWKDINWRKVERCVFKLQKRIYRASQRGDVRTVRKLQKLLTNSWYAKLLSVRRVSQDNQGKKTAGVDGVKSLSPKNRLLLTKELKLGTKVKPTRRVWIPKPNGEKRPLGIPTMKDRALQGLVKLALEPEWEAKFEPNSYGFRPARSGHDAIQAILGAINLKPKYVLDADISKCFDKINHSKLLTKLNTYPTLRRQVRAWLKAGVMDGIKLFPTNEGTPQGGVISPLLANIALHGMENIIKETSKSFDFLYHKCGKRYTLKDRQISISLIRYADDFVILHEDIRAIEKCQKVIREWLKEMGLELSQSKTRIAHTLEEYNGEKKGLEFLGFHIYQFKAGKCVSGKDTKGNKLGFKTYITPSKKSVLAHYRKLAEVVDKYKGVSQKVLITKLNPIIVGWTNYFKPYQASKQFSQVRELLWWKLWKWGIKRHPNKGVKWIKSKYWHTKEGDNWVFSTRENNNPYELIRHTKIKTNTRYTKVKGDSSPFDGNLIYWSTRMGKHPEMPKRTASLLKKQKGKCNHCGLFFKDGDILELDHIIPKSKGGRDKYENWQLLHRHCHDIKTRGDGSYKAKSVIPEDYRWIDNLLVTY
ncbi:MAG: group II intron reverse transcriptase/maturase [Cyanobacteria bacterium J149]|nr:MAG: group II intron reverse transcriptase/maturase [Cyanobacteria bacterium J149]